MSRNSFPCHHFLLEAKHRGQTVIANSCKDQIWILWNKIKLSRNFRCSSGTRSQMLAIFPLQMHFICKKLALVVGRAGQTFTCPHRQWHTSHHSLSACGADPEVSARLSWILCTPARGSCLLLPMWFLSRRHRFGLGLKCPAGSSDLAQGSCFSTGSGTASMQDFQTLQLFVLNVWLESLVYQICKVCE